jgi:type I restriction enzyme, R subunit
MTNTPSFREELVSQIPALRLLMALGGEYLPPDEALASRDVQGMYPYIKAR